MEQRRREYVTDGGGQIPVAARGAHRRDRQLVEAVEWTARGEAGQGSKDQLRTRLRPFYPQNRFNPILGTFYLVSRTAVTPGEAISQKISFPGVTEHEEWLSGLPFGIRRTGTLVSLSRLARYNFSNVCNAPFSRRYLDFPRGDPRPHLSKGRIRMKNSENNSDEEPSILVKAQDNYE